MPIHVTQRTMPIGVRLTLSTRRTEARGEFVASTIGDAAAFEVASLDNVMPTPVPEPGEAVLMALGLIGAVAAVRGRKQRGGTER